MITFSINTDTSNYDSKASAIKSSKAGSKIGVESRNAYSEFEDENDKEVEGILESQQSGNPFGKKKKKNLSKRYLPYIYKI